MLPCLTAWDQIDRQGILAGPHIPRFSRPKDPNLRQGTPGTARWALLPCTFVYLDTMQLSGFLDECCCGRAAGPPDQEL